MERRTILVTGATAGIGFHTARELASRGARVIITGRDEHRGREAVRTLSRHAGDGRIEFLPADHSTVAENRRLAGRVAERTGRLDGLVNNVGGFFNDRRETDDGYEATLALDLLAPFALTEELLPILQKSPPARVVNVASAAHAMWKGDPFADLQSEEGYLGFLAYARSKLLKIMWTFELARRLEGSGIVANATNPGMAWTSGTRGISPRGMPIVQRLFWPVFRRVQRSRSAEQAARSSIFLATSSHTADISGEYFGSDAKPGRASAPALERSNQERAWKVAATLVARAPTARPVGRAPDEERRPGR